MKVKMKEQVSGRYNDQPWPAPGGVIDLPDGVAQRLIDAKRATAVKDDDDADKGKGGDFDADAGVENAKASDKGTEKRSGGLTKQNTGL